MYFNVQLIGANQNFYIHTSFGQVVSITKIFTVFQDYK